jgi:hypothetical protein
VADFHSFYQRLPAMPCYPHRCQFFVTGNKGVAMMLFSIQNKMEMVIHQTKSQDSDRLFRQKTEKKTYGNPINPCYELDGIFKKNISFKPLATVMEILRHLFFFGQDGNGFYKNQKNAANNSFYFCFL